MDEPRLTSRLAAAEPDEIAPDGSEVRVLAGLATGGMAQFRLPAGQVSAAVRHRTVNEIWYVVSGVGRIWRSLNSTAEITELSPGLSLTIPLGCTFQFRADGSEPLVIVGVTMPPWPGPDEAIPATGPWAPTG